MSNKHLSFAERVQLEELVCRRIPIPEIANIMNRTAVLIYTELRRVKSPYTAKEGQLEFEAFYANPRCLQHKEHINE